MQHQAYRELLFLLLASSALKAGVDQLCPMGFMSYPGSQANRKSGGGIFVKAELHQAGWPEPWSVSLSLCV